jgi:alginate O-acetyltransferase complex protein AlgI
VPDKGITIFGRNFVLFVMSVLFYAWGEPVYVLLMLAQILTSYVLTWLTDLFINTYNKKVTGRIFYILSVVLPFGVLFYYKFSPTLPIGISFYTFQITSYCIDVYYGRVKRQKNLITYSTYVTLFPQLVAGPIVRYADVERILVGGIDKSKILENFDRGITRFAVGLGKKVLIANVIGEFVTEVAGVGARTVWLSWAYALAVSLQIYFDFSGYSDMAIGLGAMLGFDFPENFRYPFIAKSVSEFWRRWHITLGSWFRDYVYIPLGGNRVGFARWIFNVFVVWFFTGMWHGAGWNFILWGLYFAVFLVIEKIYGQLPQSGLNKLGKVKDVAGHIYLVIVIMVSFLIFNADNMSIAWRDIVSLVRPMGVLEGKTLGECSFILKNRVGILIIGIIGATPLPALVWGKVSRRVKVASSKTGSIAGYAVKISHAVRIFCVLALLVLCTAYIIDGSFNPFLYFRF